MHDVPTAERLDYLIVLASVIASDGHVDAAELTALEGLCRDVQIGDADRERVLASARDHDAAVVAASLARVKGDVGLRVSLLTDAITIAFADGKLAPGESDVIQQLGEALEIAPAQIALIARNVEATILGHKDDQTLSRELGTGVAASERAHHPGVIRRLYDRFRRKA